MTPPITTVDVEPYVVLVQRVDYGEGSQRRPTYRCACRRGGDGPDRKLVIAYCYTATASEPVAWSWNGDRVALEDARRIAASVERLLEDPKVREDLDRELAHRNDRRGTVEHG
jgi:hypothetical protein